MYFFRMDSPELVFLVTTFLNILVHSYYIIKYLVIICVKFIFILDIVYKAIYKINYYLLAYESYFAHLRSLREMALMFNIVAKKY